MIAIEPEGVLDPRYSSPGATPTAWSEARQHLAEAPVSWFTSVRPDGRPHATTVATVWVDDAVHIVTGPDERKARNLQADAACLVTTGTNAMEGLDVVVEGTAIRVTDDATLGRIAAAYIAKYGEMFRFHVRDASLWSEDGGLGLAFRVEPRQAFAFGKGERFSQTRWRFATTGP
jgi:hypothetical protein